jgi:hypothetical protein
VSACARVEGRGERVKVMKERVCGRRQGLAKEGENSSGRAARGERKKGREKERTEPEGREDEKVRARTEVRRLDIGLLGSAKARGQLRKRRNGRKEVSR